MSDAVEEYDEVLFIFIDESGNFDFSFKGTKNFVMAAFVTSTPFSDASKLMKLKYDLLVDGKDIDSFHATEDSQAVRDHVFNAITQLENFDAHVVFGKKEYAAPNLRNHIHFHALYAKALIKYCILKYAKSSTKQIVVLLDQALTNKQQKVFHSVVKPQLKEFGVPFRLIFQNLKYDYCGQIVDYIAWSKYIQIEREESRPWNLLTSKFDIGELDIFRNNWGRKSDHPD